MAEQREDSAAEVSALARALASRPRHKQERLCVVCGKTFLGTAKAKYCSRSCENRAFYQRRKGAHAASGDEGNAGQSAAHQPS